jgi:hypothetical protein
MRALFFGILFLTAAGLVAAIVVGVAIKLVIFFALMAATIGGILYVAGKIYGPPAHLPGELSEFDHVKR